MVRAKKSPFNVWTVAVSHDLAGLIDPERDGGIYWQRECLLAGYRKDGLPLPELTFKVDPILRRSSYRLTVNGKNVGNGELREGCLLASGPPHLLERVPGIPTRSSLAAAAGLGLSGTVKVKHRETHAAPLLWERWIARADRDLVEAMGCRTREPLYDLGAQLSHAYACFREELLTDGIVSSMLDQQRRKTPALVSLACQGRSVQSLTTIFRGLLCRHVWLGDLANILATFLGFAAKDQDARLAALRALEMRSFLEGEPTQPLASLGNLGADRAAAKLTALRALELDAALEQAIVDSFDPEDGLMKPCFDNRHLFLAVARFAADLPPSSKSTVLLVPESVRDGLEGMEFRVFDSLEVVAASDIRGRRVTPCGQVPPLPRLPYGSLAGSEPELRLEPLEFELGRAWQGHRQALLEAGDRLRETLADLGLALPEVVAHCSNLLPHETLVVTLRQEECLRLSVSDVSRLDALLAETVEKQIGSLLSGSAIFDLLEAAAQRWPDPVVAIRECYTDEELQRLYLALFRERISCRYQSGILGLLSRSKDNLYALVQRIRALSPPTEVHLARFRQTWKVEVGAQLQGTIGRLREQLESLYALYRQDGLPMPDVDFAVSTEVGSRCYRVRLGSRILGHGQLRQGLLIATAPAGSSADLPGLPGETTMVHALAQLGWAAGQRRENHTLSPAYVPHHWIHPEDRQTYESQGWRVRHPLFDFGAGLYAAYCMHFQEVLSPELLDLALLEASDSEPGLRQDVLAWHSPRSVRAAVSGLIESRISMPDLSEVFRVLRCCRHPARYEVESHWRALERSLRRRATPWPVESSQLDTPTSQQWHPVLLGRQTQAELTRAALAEELGEGFELPVRLRATLLEILADQSNQLKGLTLHLPQALHAPVLAACANPLRGLLRLAEMAGVVEKPAISTLAWVSRHPGLERNLPTVRLRAETVAIELGRAWRAQRDDLEEALLGCFACRIKPELGIEVGKRAISVSAHLPVDGICLRIGGQELGFLKPPALGIELLELAPLGALRGPVLRLPALELEARLREPELSEYGQADKQGWTDLMFFVIEDFLKGHLEQLVTRASVAALLKKARLAWPHIVEVVANRWSLDQVRAIYIELLRRKISVQDHRTILSVLARPATPADLARGQDSWEKALESARLALSDGFVPNLAVEGLLRVITLDQQLCEELRSGLSDSGPPHSLSARAEGRLREVLERHGRDVHHASVLLAPPDLRRALELTLTNRVRCPVLSLTEIPAGTEMALEVCLTLL